MNDVGYGVAWNLGQLVKRNIFLRENVFSRIKRLQKRFHVRPPFEHCLKVSKAIKEVAGEIPETFDPPETSKYKIGVLRDPLYNHENYCLACMKLGVSYRIIDWLAADWVQRIKTSGCDAFVGWPGENIREWKQTYDNRLRLMVEDLQVPVYPAEKALWIYGSKERQHAWLEIHGFPHPDSWTFYDRDEAIRFVETFDGLNCAKSRGDIGCLVAKVDIGSGASGVRIIHTKAEAYQYINRAFDVGTDGAGFSNKQTRQWRHVTFQRHIGEAREWRMIRYGNGYWGYGKGKKGDFHSGSGLGEWDTPEKDLLDLTYEVSEKLGASSLSMDVFVTPSGAKYINEIQCIFGAVDPAQMYVDGVPGRFVRSESGQYTFEKGVFCTNHGCDLRIMDVIHLLDKRQLPGG